MDKHAAIDLDDVTVDFWAGVLEAFEVEFGVRPEYDGQPWGELATALYTHPAFKEAGYKDWWGWLRDREWLWARFPAVPGALGGIKRLRHNGWYVEAVTSKPEWAEHNVWKWLGHYRPAFHRVTIITNGQSKVDFTDASVMVDDKLATCVDFVKDGRSAVVFDRARAFVGDDALSPYLRRASDWEEVIESLEALHG